MLGQMPKKQQSKKQEQLVTNEDIFTLNPQKEDEYKSTLQNRTIRRRINKIDVGTIEGDLLPVGSYDLGSSSSKFRDLWISRNANIGGELNHDGTKIGFYGATTVVKTTVADLGSLTAQTLTDSTTGTADLTVADVGAAYTRATLNNNFADLIAQINKIVADLDTLKTKQNALLDALQSYGLV